MRRQPAAAAIAFTLFSLAACGGGHAPATPAPEVHTAMTFAEFASADVRKAAQTYPDVALELEAPMSLTTSDGTGLALSSLRARAVIDGPLAFTELRLRFRNPEPRVLEGRFSITLPDGAAISRLAMSIDGKWQEAEVVERQLAHRAYEDFLHRRQDPALLEKEAGNQFRARIFPIPANGSKDIIVSYSHVMAQAGDDYRIPLVGLPEIAALDIEAAVTALDGSTRSVKLARARYKPEQDFTAKIDSSRHGLRAGHHSVVRIRPRLENKTRAIKKLTILFDTSASRAPGFAASVANLGRLVEGLRAKHGGALDLTVAAFDQETQLIHAGPASTFGAKQLTRVRARRPLGASDLSQAFSWLRQRKTSGRLLIISDGITTAGPTESGELKAALKSIAGLDRVDTILSGGIRDRQLATALVRGTLASDGAVIEGDESIDAQVASIGLETRSDIKVAVDGAAWTWPQRIDGLQPGQDVVVFASMLRKNPRQLTVRLSGGLEESIVVKTAAAVAPLVSRSVAGAEIARLDAKRGALTGASNRDARAALKKQIIDISTRHRVLSDYTALLVLETDDDYKRFGIDRKALTKILTIGPRGIELSDRAAALTIADGKPTPAETTSDPGDQSEPSKPGDARDPSMPEAGKDASKTDAAPRDQLVAKPKPETKTPASVVDMREKAKKEVADFDDDDDDDFDEAESDDESSVSMEAPDSAGGEASEFERNLRDSPPAYTGRMATIMALVDAQKSDKAIASALAWRNDEPGDVMALIALGASLELAGNHRIARRAYGSIIDLFPSRADLRRFAGARLQRLRGGANLANDSFTKSIEQRPDHLTGYRLSAYALVRAGRLAEAFDAAEAGLEHDFPSGRFNGGKRILSGDLSIIAAAWARAEPQKGLDIKKRLAKHGLRIASAPSLRFVLNWETDANDVDFHIFDGKGGHAYYSEQTLPSGGELYEDITNGYGPECFAIEGEPSAYPYRLQIHYYSRGPMGYGMGQVEILHHDGEGNLTFQERPFVVMSDSAYLDLGQVSPPSKPTIATN